jgi:N-acetylneuraminic acid mutarotase
LAGAIFVFGGCNSSSRLNDFQIWNSSTARWSEMDKNSSVPPTPREGHGLVSLETLQKLYLFGGIEEFSGKDRLSADLYEFDLRTSKWKNLTQLNDRISARSHFGFTTASDKIYVFGGIVDAQSCILFEYNPLNLISTCLKQAAGYPKYYHIMPGFASVNGRFYIFGGIASNGKVITTFVNHFWLWPLT